jgi:ATP-binding protein involved in chromosome partitioning
MSVYVCPHCGHEDHVFGHGGAQEEALRRNVPFLGEIALNAEIRQKSDAGEPIGGNFYKGIANAVLSSVKSA